ncbi:PREDICTED: tetratricopeptide repeat protein 39B-like isoform X3 [Papilio polytes]|uniref:tetratricopeptide repeat protein 39B-like isoform X3 n=1 Tax=Papilio polytes TaxID=76194 RepID=UPI000676694D|nr:PREDICTED: tetratricopeptide repeat protein 39B-like isoform X3 [Papilio polytes]
MSSDDHQKKKGGGRKRSARRRARNAADREEPPGPLITLPQDLRAHLDMDGDNAQDNFQDASGDSPDPNVNLQMALDDCEMAIKRFFNNELDSAMGIMEARSRTSIYHSLGVSIFEFIPAVLTLDSAQVGRAIQSLKLTVQLCNQNRRSYTIMQTIGTIMAKPNYSTMTDTEAHAELCYAESMLLQAALCVIEGEDIAAFLRATMKIKNSYNTYKECSRILEKKTWASIESRQHFHSGVRLGLATFNIMIALLPARIITLLEYVGFSGDKEAGLAELQIGAKQPGLRGVLCEIVSLGIHLVVSHFAGATPNIHQCREIIDAQLKVYPEGVWFLLFEGRLELLRGRCALAAATYRRVAETRHLWPQLRHLCYWELMWASAAAPLYRQKIAGKSLPMEKWVLMKCSRYTAQGGRLMMPAMELLCLWNLMSALAADVPTLHYLLKKIDNASETLDREETRWPAALIPDNRALIFYLRGCCLSALGMQRLAIQQFDKVVGLKNMIKLDTFLVPYSLYEAASCHYNLGETDRAVRMWQETRKGYSNYSLESRLHFRLHSKLEMAQKASGQAATNMSLPSRSPKHTNIHDKTI